LSQIFLSYARDDVDAARQLADGLAQAGHDVWWDRHLHGGSRFDREIEEALSNAEAVVVIWSKASLDSAWVKDEAAEARDSERLVPVSIDSAKPPLGFRQFHTIDLGSWTGHGLPEALDALLDAISKTCGSQSGQHKLSATDSTEKRPTVSICVLPFVNMSGEPEQEYFSDGISEDIITDLSNVSALSVVSRNTSFTFKGLSLDVKEVVEKLGVSHVLEGSVRKAGNRVRITAQLIDGAKDDHIWAARYDRDLTDIFEIQDEISKAIVEALQVKLLPAEKRAIENRGTSNVDAYNLYLMARQQWISGDYSDVRRDEAIVRICKQALSLDANYAQAWALIALAEAQLRLRHGKDIDALPAAERALSINPDLAEAHCVKAQLLEERGKKQQANEEIDAALRLDSESWEVNREAGRLLFRQGRIRDSVIYFEKAARLMENDWHSPMMLVTCYQSMGDENLAIQTARMALERAESVIAKNPANANILAMGVSALALIGEDRRAREWIERALLLDPDNTQMRYNLACALALRLNDADGAIEMLGPYFEQETSPTLIRHLEADPDLDPVRDDPRFKKMLDATKNRLGLSEAAE
jgi:adenylate cyclase